MLKKSSIATFGLESFSRLSSSIFLLFLAMLGNAQETVNRDVPDIYKTSIEPLLTPLEEVLPLGGKYADDESGAILLDEDIDFVGEDGALYQLRRQVNLASTEAGVEVLKRDSFRFRKLNEEIILVSAQTIQPDGSVIPVRENAALIQDISEAGNDLYEDRAELILLFPKLEPGCVTESIVLKVRKCGFRVPGEYMTYLPWKGNIWPQARGREVIEVPHELGNRLSFTEKGAGVPGMQKESVANGKRIRFTWVENPQARRKSEPNQPSILHTGPVTRITSWNGWRDLATWYEGLLQGRDELSDDLENKLDEWTDGLDSHDEIIESLYSVVANDVRYVGLEFGIAGLQPYKCSEVWANGYGDCKDKSNLLRALLNAKGIESYIALVDTDGVGIVDREWPSYQPFSHAILAVRDSETEGGWRFLDPTISRAKAGTLGQWVADRNVLILKDGEAEWARTPDRTAGEIQYNISLELDTAGTLSGWFEMNTSGYYASSYSNSYAEQGRESAIRSMQNLVQAFYPRAEVIDLAMDPIRESHEDFQLRAYFVTPHPFPESDNDPIRLPFPGTGMILPGLGETRNREASWFLWKDTVGVELRLKVPPGWSPGKLPRPIVIDSATVAAKGEWVTDKYDPRVAVGEMEVVLRRSRIAPSQFASAFNAVNSLSTWAKRPAEFSVGEDAEVTTAPATDEDGTVTLPIMPTGKGQLDLVDVRYPTSRGLKEREAALRQVIQYFPDDKETQFSARAQIAYLAYLKDDYAKSVSQLDSVIGELGDYAVTEMSGWAKYIKGLNLLEMQGRESDGIEILEKISQSSDYSNYRKAWAAAYASQELMKTQEGETVSPERLDKVVALIEPCLFFEEDDAVTALYSIYSDALLRQGSREKLTDALQLVVDRKHPLAANIFRRLADDSMAQVFSEVELNSALHPVLESLDLSTLSEIDPEIEKSISDLVGSTELRRILVEIQDDLEEMVPETGAPEWLTKGKIDESLESVGDFSGALEELNNSGDSANFVATAFHYLTEFEPQADFPRWFWRLLSHTEWNERPPAGETRDSVEDSEWFPKFARLSERFPKSNTYYWECRFTVGRWLNYRGQFEEEAELHRNLLDDPEFDPEFSISAINRGGLAFEKSGNLKEAEKLYLQAIDEMEDVARAVDSIFRAALIRLETNEIDGALELFDQIREIDRGTIENADYSNAIFDFLELTDDASVAKAYWEATAEWWPRWIALAEELPGVENEVETSLVGLIDNYTVYQEAISRGVEDKDGSLFLTSYRLPAHLSRWYPDMLGELARLTIYGAEELLPAKTEELRAFVVDSYRGATPVDEANAGNFWLYYQIALADDYPEKGIRIAQDYLLEHSGSFGSSEHSIAKIWANCALRMNDTELMQESAEFLDARLDSPDEIDDRMSMIESLADLYRRLGNLEAEKALLTRESQNPVVRNDRERLSTIRERLENLSQSALESERFADSIRAWIDQNELPWLPHSEPKSLEDRRLRDLPNLIHNGSGAFDDYGNAKMRLLVAEKSELPVEDRWASFRIAVEMLAYLNPNFEERMALYGSVLELDDLPASYRNHFLYVSTFHAVEHFSPKRYSELREHPLAKDFWNRNDPRLEVADAFLSAAPEDPASRVAAAEKIAEEAVTSVGLHFLMLIHRELLAYGHETEAETLRDIVKDCHFDGSVNEPPSAIRLRMLQVRKEFLQRKEQNKAAANLIGGELGFDRAIDEKAASSWQPDALPAGMSDEKKLGILLRNVKSGNYHFWRAEQWFELCQGLPNTEAMVELKFRIAKIFINGSEDDMDRSLALLSLSSLLDTDSAPIRHRIEKEIFDVWENRQNEAPLTHDAVQFEKVGLAFRTGDSEVDPEVDLRSIRHPYLGNSCTRVILAHSLATDDNTALERTLSSLEADELVSEYLVSMTLRAAEKLDLEAEAELIREEAVRLRNRDLVSAWAAGNPSAADSAIELIHLLGDAPEIPGEWLPAVLDRIGNERIRLGLQIEYSFNRENWERAVRLSQQAVEKYPTYYHFHGLLGRAAHNLGDFATAQPALDTFLKFAHDSLEYRKAKEMLESIEGGGK